MEKPYNLSDREMITEIWKWTFGNGRPGAEQRIGELESKQPGNATRADVQHIEVDIKKHITYLEEKMEKRTDKLQNMIAQKAVIEIIAIIGTIVAMFIIRG